MNKKGMDISLNFIILAVLALLALILVALFFTGGLQDLFTRTGDVSDMSAHELAYYRGQCTLYCTTNNRMAWFDTGFPEDLTYGKEHIDSCEVFDLGKEWDKDDKCKTKTTDVVKTEPEAL